MAEAYFETTATLDELRPRLVSALQSCSTIADLVQILYAYLHPVFGYEIINMTVLEREGWAAGIAIEAGILQDRRRKPLSELTTNYLFEEGRRSAVFHPVQETIVQEPAYPFARFEHSRGPGAAKLPRTVIWFAAEHQEQVVGAVTYQSYQDRHVATEELDFLKEIHRHLGVLIANARLNETTRDQAMRLTALNAVARALSETLDERGVVNALRGTLNQLLPVDGFELAVWSGGSRARVRLLTQAEGHSLKSRDVGRDSRLLALTRTTLETGQSRIFEPARGPYASAISVAVKEGGQVRGAFSLQASAPEAYEESTLNFLEQVADQVALALRNAWSYSESEAQRRRLEVVNAVGRRLASSLDKWSIMRTLREELTRHLHFDGFILATITDTPEGVIAEGYQYVSGVEQPVYAVPLAVAGPSREAYETGRPVLLRRNPWARSVEAQHPAPESLIVGEGAAAFVAPGPLGRVASRSLLWVPVMSGDRVTALLSLQSYRVNAFKESDVQLLQDVAAHVSLALANADHFMSAQRERRRLEALHAIEVGLAGSADERQIAEAVFTAAHQYVDASHLVLAYLDSQGRVTGFGSEEGTAPRELEALRVEKTGFFRRLMESAQTITAQVEGTPEELRTSAWVTDDPRIPKTVLWVPVLQGGRVVAALSAQRLEDRPFEEIDVQLLESAAPLVGIALRTVRLHRSNELALEHSVRIQEVAALAGHDLAGVVSNVAEQARAMLGSPGVACWAFDAEGRVSVYASSGDPLAEKVLNWAGKERQSAWSSPSASSVLKGTARGMGWDMIPLWYADRLVGALGAVHGLDRVEDPGGAALDFARHAAIAIENARLVAETRGRIHTLEAVAAFTELDPTQPAGTRAEIGRLVERALQSSRGSLWLLEAGHLAKVGEGEPRRLRVGDATWLLDAFRGRGHSRQLRQLLKSATDDGSEPYAYPILVDGQLAGMVTAHTGGASPGETRRLMSVLAGQAGVVLGRVWLVDALDRERRMMNAILRHSPVGVVLQDALGRIIYANPAVERMYDVPATSMVGHTSNEILNIAQATPVSSSETAEGDFAEFQVGDLDRIIRMRTVPIPGLEDEPAGTLSMHEDVTQQRRVMEAKDLMLRAIGHEVRSPAAAMKSTLAGLVQWGQDINPSERQVLLEEAYEMSDRLLNLVENQLIIAKLETRRFEPNPAPVSLRQALDQVLGVLWHRYGERTSQVHIKVDPALPDAYCEPTHLNQVLTNLVGNALEYTTARIRVTARSRAGWLEITVADDGPGVPAERAESLFEKTAPAGQNRARGGLGLGLYLCRLVVERSFGGRIWLESGEGHGATFRFTVPTVASSVKQAAAGAR